MNWDPPERIAVPAPYVFLGPADYVSYVGERPIAITWRLRLPMPAELFQQARVAVG